MGEYSEGAADRLERAADRMYNSGFLEEERRFRDAAARIRSGLSLEETQALEHVMLSGQKPSLVARLTAFAAIGEYDDGGGADQSGAGSAPGDDAQAPDLTLNASGANQLLSTAFAPGLPSPFDTSLNGWQMASPGIDPYTAATTANDDNPNPYTTGQNIWPYSGNPNTDSFAGDATSPQSTQSTATGWSAFGLNGPPPSLLASPDLLALNTAVPGDPNIASDATGTGPVTLQVGTEQWTYSGSPVSDQGLNTYYRFDSGDGSMYALVPTGGGTPVIYNSNDNYVVGQLDANGTFQVPGGVQADTATTPQQTLAPTPPTTVQNATPASPQLTAGPDAQLTAAIQQAVGATDSNPPNPGPPTGINDVIAGTDLDPSNVPQGQLSEQPGASPGPSVAQIQEENWDVAKAGMWDSAVDLAQGLVKMSMLSALGPAGLLGPTPSLDFAKFGAPAPTGDPVRDAELQDNYSAGGWVTTTVALAAPIGAEGLLDSALSAAGKLPGLTGFGMGGGGEIIGFTEQWLSGFGESLESIAPALENSLPEEATEEAIAQPSAQHHIFPQEFREEFEELGIDIDQYTIKLDPQTEHIPLHVGVNTEEWAGGYNDHWAVFLEQEGLTAQQAFDFATELLNDLGMAGPEYPVVPYR